MKVVLISLSVLASVLCDNKMPTEAKQCEQHIAACYNESIKADWAQKFEPEYRKAIVTQHCLRMEGYLRFQ